MRQKTLSAPTDSLKSTKLLRPRLVRCAARQTVLAASRHNGASTQAKWLADVSAAIQQVKSGLAAAVCSGILLASPASAVDNIVRLPASGDPKVLAAQTTMVEAWSIVRESFVDEQFNHHNWEDELRSHMVAAYNSANPQSAWKEIGNMLSDLGDPYTRIMPAEEYAQFKVSSDGELQGVGMLIANEPVNGHLLVLAPIKGGPAERAGVQPGDEVLSINGQSMEGWTGEKAAKVLRGQGGTEVKVKLARRTDQIPGVPGRPEAPLMVQYREVSLSLKRERVNLSPVYYTALHGAQGDDVGYIRLVSFSNNAASEMQEAIRQLQARQVHSFILDLRNNPGGLVRAGIDVASLWMDGSPTVFHVTSRDEDLVQTVALEQTRHSLTQDPLVVLVNENSASASEIVSGALHDNHRAVIVGDKHTYGKGKIQSVFELQDGSALFVTVAKYRTPSGTDIDKKGIVPDSSCMVPPMAVAGSAYADAEEAFMAGLPYEQGAALALHEQLASDKCVIKAEYLLQQQAQEAPSLQVAARPL